MPNGDKFTSSNASFKINWTLSIFSKGFSAESTKKKVVGKLFSCVMTLPLIQNAEHKYPNEKEENSYIFMRPGHYGNTGITQTKQKQNKNHYNRFHHKQKYN